MKGKRRMTVYWDNVPGTRPGTFQTQEELPAVACFQALSFLGTTIKVERMLGGIKNVQRTGGFFIFDVLGRGAGHDVDAFPGSLVRPVAPDSPIPSFSTASPTNPAPPVSSPPFIYISHRIKPDKKMSQKRKIKY